MPDFGVYPIESLSQDESESTFENKSGLADDLKFLASMPELCDVTFLVGETREPVCAVKVIRNRTQRLNVKGKNWTLYLSQAILAARSRIFHKLLYQQQASPQRKNQPNPPPVSQNKLRLFLKRSSEPLLNIQNESQKVKIFLISGIPRKVLSFLELFLIEGHECSCFGKRRSKQWNFECCRRSEGWTFLGPKLFDWKTLSNEH